jgi:hypothetical protein
MNTIHFLEVHLAPFRKVRMPELLFKSSSIMLPPLVPFEASLKPFTPPEYRFAACNLTKGTIMVVI